MNKNILKKVNMPNDIKELSFAELDKLSLEIADFLVENVSKTGGHLSPNLGVVDLTIALHKVFDTKEDRFIFDVGHQAYVHKILTGRKDKFNSLRKKDGLSGFTKPEESIHDAFISGHASISISVGLGMAHARTLNKKNHHIVSIIGDGALTGGLVYEALNNAGEQKEPLIVILNDNRMSIMQNVGGVSSHLSLLRTSKKYLKIKQKTNAFLSKHHNGRNLARFINKTKKKLKKILLDMSFFEQMGLIYLGPIDGHNIKEMCLVFERAKELNKPVLIHILTKKGKGYNFSEKNPELFHGVSPFDVETGEILSKSENSFSSNFGKKLVKIAKTNEKICAVTASMGSSVGLLEFSEKYPKRYFDVGIAESHAVTMSAGLAKEGITPICAIYSTFLQRSYDQLIHDVALLNLHVVFAIDRAGIVGEDGETHNGVFDIPMISNIPNFEIFAPSNYIEQEKMLEKAINEINSPIVIRYPRGSEGEFKEDTSDKDFAIFNENGNITIVTYGTIINQVLPLIKKYDIKIIKINKINKDFGEIIENITDKVIFVEDCIDDGCIGQKIMSDIKKTMKYTKRINIKNTFVKQASVSEIYDFYNISTKGIEKIIKEALLCE